MDLFRKVLFRIHLCAGVVAGVIILVMSVTGILLAYEKQMVAALEKFEAGEVGGEVVLDRIVDDAVGRIGSAPASVSVQSDVKNSVGVTFGRDQVLYYNPHTAAYLGEGATGLRSFLHGAEEMHRWLGGTGGAKNVGRGVTGACSAAFVVLILTGPVVWWPKNPSRKKLKAQLVPDLRARGKSRDWNWHNSVGIWSAPVLLVIAGTGVIMSYPWAGNLLYTLTGTEVPPARKQAPASPAAAYVAPVAGWTKLLQSVRKQATSWRTIQFRLSAGGKGPWTATVEEADAPHPFARSSMTLDPVTAAVIKWEPFSANNAGRKLRSWVRPLHTGEAFGWLGQGIALLASAGAALLVWTGLALSWRRFFGGRPRTNSPIQVRSLSSPIEMELTK